jgi:hypothetical protein
MTNQISGVIHGKTIELSEDPGLTDGQAVVVVVQPAGINPKTNRPWGEGIRASAGAFADDPNADKYIEEILNLRKLESSREIPE